MSPFVQLALLYLVFGCGIALYLADFLHFLSPKEMPNCPMPLLLTAIALLWLPMLMARTRLSGLFTLGLGHRINALTGFIKRMPQVNGNNYRSFGQGYAAEKQKMGADGADNQVGAKGGSIAHVKHHGGGKYSVKTDDGEVSQHESAEDMHSALDQHFGLQESEGNEGADSYDDDGDDDSGALKSILG